MTELLANVVIVLTVLLGLSQVPLARKLMGDHSAKSTRLGLLALMASLYVFSLHETVTEDGVLYGVSFSLIPLLAGAVVIGCYDQRQRRKQSNP